MKHKGQIVEKIVRRSGYSITKLAKKLQISRNTLYNRFANPNLGYSFIMDVGSIIHYDFTIDFPEIKVEADSAGERRMASMDKGAVELIRVEGKYVMLLERYTKLLGILIKVANDNDMHELKKEIMEFTKSEP